MLFVPWVSGSQPAPTWLYTRGTESVRIEVRDHGAWFELVVRGPGERRRFVECADHWAVIESQIAEEAHMLALGYTLERFTTARSHADESACDGPVAVRNTPANREETRS